MRVEVFMPQFNQDVWTTCLYTYEELLNDPNMVQVKEWLFVDKRDGMLFRVKELMRDE